MVYTVDFCVFLRPLNQEDNCKKTYSLVKMMSQFQFGIPSQCCVHGKYSATRSKEQYCSNIALKCNTKLMNVYNQGRVWNTVHDGRNGLAWIAEAPTMVIGVDLSHGKLIFVIRSFMDKLI